MRTRMLALATIGFIGCGGPPKQPADIAQQQAALTPDTAQARLWQEAAQSGAATGAAVAYAESGLVRTRAPLSVPQRAAQGAEQPFPATVDAAARVLAMPELEGPLTGSATVRAVDGEFLTLDLGGGRTLRLQAKVDGGPLTARLGDTARIYLRSSGDPFARDEVLTLRLPGDDLVHAFVGGTKPVAVRLEAPALAAAQVGSPEGNSMAVAVTLGSERQTLRSGERASFRAAGLTVELLASTAIQGEAAHAVEGDPYRIELIAWRTRKQ